MTVENPRTEQQTLEIVRQAFESNAPLAIEGHATKLQLGRKSTATHVLNLSGLTGITLYEPEEMVITARAGTPLADIEETLARHGQCLAFEPGDVAELWGGTSGAATIGGTISAGICGPRRFSAGAARDHLLGFTGINGMGERFKAGGKVVKNVTGYDLPKLAAGSFGTLFVMTEVTLRTVPRGSTAAYLSIEGLSPEAGLKCLRRAAASPLDPTGLAYLPAMTASRLTGKAHPVAIFRLEGQASGVAARATELCRTLGEGASTLDNAQGAKIFHALTHIAPLFSDAGELWRLSIPPANATEMLAALSPSSWAADWAGGLLWCETNAAQIHTLAKKAGGHATLFRKPSVWPDSSEVFPPLDPATRALTLRLKDAFDPARILNPGRMYKDM